MDANRREKGVPLVLKGQGGASRLHGFDKPECVTMFDDVSAAQRRLSRGRVNRVKMPLFIASAFLTLSATSHAAPPGGGLHGGSFRSGFVAHSPGPAFTMGSGIRRNFAFRPAFAFHQKRRFFHRDHRFFSQQFAWPVYWYPYYPYDCSYLDYGPDNDYQYWDNSAASVQPESFRSSVDHGPVVVVIDTAIPGPWIQRPILRTSIAATVRPTQQGNKE
jgi:hypothetical protein